MEIKLSIAICTYNRCKYLVKCINALINQDLENVEILIIDNGSIDNTYDTVSKLITPFPNIRYILESTVGLSHARNRAINECYGSWILYLDDDTIPVENFTNRAKYLCKLDKYDCIGGIYNGYFEAEKPRWIRSDIGDKIARFPSIYECPHNEPHGGVVLYRVAAVKESGYFNASFGMNENKIAFAEETEMQYRLEKNGYKIAMDPKLTVIHLNKPERYNLPALLLLSFYHGRDSLYKNKDNIKVIIFKNLKSFLALILLRIPKSLIKLIVNSNYYIQNFLYDCIHPNIFYLGQLIAITKLFYSKYK